MAAGGVISAAGSVFETVDPLSLSAAAEPASAEDAPCCNFRSRSATILPMADSRSDTSDTLKLPGPSLDLCSRFFRQDCMSANMSSEKLSDALTSPGPSCSTCLLPLAMMSATDSFFLGLASASAAAIRRGAEGAACDVTRIFEAVGANASTASPASRDAPRTAEAAVNLMAG